MDRVDVCALWLSFILFVGFEEQICIRAANNNTQRSFCNAHKHLNTAAR